MAGKHGASHIDHHLTKMIFLQTHLDPSSSGRSYRLAPLGKSARHDGMSVALGISLTSWKQHHVIHSPAHLYGTNTSVVVAYKLRVDASPDSVICQYFLCVPPAIHPAKGRRSPMAKRTLNTAVRDAASHARRKKAFIYLRVSTEEQAQTDFDADGYSIKAQREACFRTAGHLDADVVGEFIDPGESAKFIHRTALQRLIKELRERGDIDYVIIEKVDRLARNRKDDIDITLAIQAAGAKLVSAKENIDETPHGRLMHGIMACFAEFYSLNLAAEAMKGSRQKAKAGGTPYKPPIGYRSVGVLVEGRSEVRTVIIDPDRAPLVAWAFEAYATGDYTLEELTDALEERGLKHPATKKLPARPLSRSSVHHMLRNPYYIGVVNYEGVPYGGRHETFVNEDVFLTVQSILAARAASGEKPQKRPHYLKGRLFCGHCGARMGVSFSRGRNGTQYPYFYCLGRQRQKTSCPQGFVAMEDVERATAEYWATTVRLSETQAERIRETILARHAARRTHRFDEIAAQRRRIERLEHEQRKLTEAYLADALPMSELKREQERVQRELRGAQAILQQHEAEAANIEEAVDEALLLARAGAAAYLRAAPETKRQLLQAAFEKLWILDQGITDGELSPTLAAVLGVDQAATVMDDQITEPLVPLETDTDCAVDPGSQFSVAVAGEIHRRGLDGHQRVHLPRQTKNPNPMKQGQGSNVVTLAPLAGRKLNPSLVDYLRKCADAHDPNTFKHPPAQDASVYTAPQRRALTTRLSSSDIDDLITAFQSGMSRPALARRYKISISSVARILKRHRASQARIVKGVAL